MFRRTLSITLIMILSLSIIGMSFADIATPLLDTDNNQLGSIAIDIDSENEFRVLINNGDQKSTFTVTEDINLPLSLGNGTYNIAIYEKINGRFRLQENTSIDLNLENETDLYLNSVQSVNWNEEMEAVKIAQTLTQDLTTNLEKIEAIHTYIVENITYDFTKARTVQGGYIPTIDSTLETGNGICYDYASLFASMLRSVGVPTKLTIGHVGSLYHAWNEVYLDETDEWVTVDSTFDAMYYGYGINYTLFKTSSRYGVEKIF